MMPMLDLENISHSYNEERAILSNVSLKIMAGEFISILGPSGSGKSTLLRIISGLEKQTSGKVKLNNNIVSDDNYHSPPEKRNLGLVVQDKSLFPHLNVLRNVTFGIRGKKDRDNIGKDLLKLFKVDQHEKKFPNELSGGEQQRVALARSLAPKPNILLLDEPFSALDDDLKEELYLETKKIIQDKKMTVLMVTHDKNEADIFSDKIIFLENGRIK
mgnify:FL=1|tara:strand:- start:1624 stop:2271 length:648 start_codon:yes stop_codon:yes gene_type:complete